MQQIYVNYEDLILSPLELIRLKKFGTTHYKPEFADMVFNLLSETEKAKNKSHCCRLLTVSKRTLLEWMEKHPEFEKAIKDGLELGKSKWYNRLIEHAFEPSYTVNNGLIKMISANIYGIKDEESPTTMLVNNNTNFNNNSIDDIEQELRNRGIPMPIINVKDIKEE